MTEPLIQTSPTPRPMCCVVITASDTRTLTDDRSGELIISRLEDAGHQIRDRLIIKEDFNLLSEAVQRCVQDPTIEVILLTGGTGITRRDLSPDVIASFGTKHLPGFGELFRWLSYAEIGSSTIQSRACAWLCHDTLAFSLPGSTSAVRLALDQILIPQLDVRHRPCNFAQLMPRIKEDQT